MSYILFCKSKKNGIFNQYIKSISAYDEYNGFCDTIFLFNDWY